jgi:hypothetical protein
VKNLIYKGLKSVIIEGIITKVVDGVKTTGINWDNFEESVNILTSTNTSVITPQYGESVIKTGVNKWGLRSQQWNLSKAAADYYLLQLAVFIDKDKFKPYLDKHTGILVDQFARYTDMAIGGEIRHVADRSGMIKRLEEAINNNVLYGSRNSAWEGWYWFRQQYGTLALKWLVTTYNDSFRWKAGYGGEAWGKIANTLLMFEEGKLTPHSFVDTCFGLEHNGGGYFDKWWNTKNVKSVLDRNQSGLYCDLLMGASHIIKQLMPEDKIKELCLCGIHSN